MLQLKCSNNTADSLLVRTLPNKRMKSFILHPRITWEIFKLKMFAYSRVDSNFNLASRGIPQQVPVIFLIIQSLQQRLINIFLSIVNYLLLSLNPSRMQNHRRDTNGNTKHFHQVINSRHLLNSSAGFALKANSVQNWLKWKSLLSSLRHETMKKGILLIAHFLIISVEPNKT